MAISKTVNHTRSLDARARADRWLEVFATTEGNVGKTDELTNTSKSTRNYWQKTWPDFKHRKQMVMAGHSQARFKAHPGIWSEGFETYCKQFFGQDMQPQQSRIADILDNIKPREVVLVLLWPEARKTSTLENWVCKRVALDPDVRITYLGESTDHAKRVLGFIKDRMTAPEPEWIDYQSRFGPFFVPGQEDDNKPWTQNYITVNRSTHAQRDRTIQCRAITSRAYGSRIDILIGDDIQSRQTFTQTKSIIEKLRQTYFTRGKRQTSVFVGNRIGNGDVYDWMIEEFGNEPWFHLVQLVAASGDVPTVPEAWAERSEYPTQEAFLEAAKVNLAQIRRQVGEDVWWSSYQQSPRQSTLASFSGEMIDNAKDHERAIAPAPPGTLVYLSLDPSMAGTVALLAAAFHRDRLEILDLVTIDHPGSLDPVFTHLRQFGGRYHPTGLIVEINAFQKSLITNSDLRRIATEYGFWMRPHTTGTNKADPTLGVAAMASSFLSAQVRIPYADDHARARMAPLLFELETWRPNIPTRLLKQDTVMALWFAWRHWQEWRQTVRDDTVRPASRPSWLRGLVGARG